jgi:prolyl-tRNA synthetase
MRASRYFISTQKEAPADAEVVSHQLMLRAGLIRRLAGGIYTYMPMGLRTLKKIENIVREEMLRADAIELLMPVIQPAELWQESGRWVEYGPELLRIKDRHGRDFVVQPTSEEVVTDVARRELRSYKQLPINFFHIQTKFRDEIRPRFGVMRGREFTMKDAYSFDRDVAGLQVSYRKMYDAYTAIFTRLGLRFRAVGADTGSIGGAVSQEFHVLADSGEDALAYSTESDYAANVELAEALGSAAGREEPKEDLKRVSTPGRAKCEDVAELLGIPLARTVKSIVLATDTDDTIQLWLLLLRGDHEMNELKVRKLEGLGKFRFATEAEIIDWFGTRPGYLGPLDTVKPVELLADRSVAMMSDFVTGANQPDFHVTGVNWGRDLPEPRIADLRNVVPGDPSPDGRGKLAICRGIEVGHIFQLGQTYSLPLGATFLDENGRAQHFEMGCYGIGITRTMGAAIEQNYDDRGIVWPIALAPFEVVICPIGWGKSDPVRRAANELYQQLISFGVDAMLDDRDERPGVMFADWELIGVPLRITIGERGLANQEIELTIRHEGSTQQVAIDGGANVIKAKLSELSRV